MDIVQVETLEAFTSYVEKTFTDHADVLFRGQSAESAMLEEFKRHSVPFVRVPPPTPWDWMALAQHHMASLKPRSFPGSMGDVPRFGEVPLSGGRGRKPSVIPSVASFSHRISTPTFTGIPVVGSTNPEQRSAHVS
jgi:hypothetical protein